MGRQATINKEDVISARDYLRSTGKAHGIIAIRNHIGHGSPGLIGRLLGRGDTPGTPGFPIKSETHAVTKACAEKKYLIDALASGEKEIQRIRQTMTQLEERVTTAETECSVMTATIRAKEREILRQREIFENWKRDLEQERKTPIADTVQSTRLASPPTPKSYNVEQLDLYKSDNE